MTKPEIKISLPLIDLSDRKVLSVKECSIVLYPEHLEYKVITKYQQLSESTDMWENVSANYRWTRKRSSIAEVNMLYCNDEQMYVVGIDVLGADSNCWHWADPKAALAVYNQLRDYMLGKTLFVSE
jgi:hypothetical protein